MSEEPNSDATAETTAGEHPLKKQYDLERRIQLEGRRNPKEFKMSETQTLHDVQQANLKTQTEEGKKDAENFRDRMVEQSQAGLRKGESLGMNKQGVILDLTTPPKPEEPAGDQTDQHSENQGTPEKKEGDGGSGGGAANEDDEESSS